MLLSEAFSDGDRRSGVLLRDLREGEIATFVSFELEGGLLYRAEQVTEVGDRVTEWSTFRFAEALSGIVTQGARTAEGVVLDGVVLERGAVPSYLAHRAVVELAVAGGERLAFRQLDEHGEPEVHDVEVVARGSERVELPGGTGGIDATRFDLLLDGEPYTAIWWDGVAVVVSDWTAGSMSVLVPDLATALADCPVPVAEAAREWVAGRGLDPTA